MLLIKNLIVGMRIDIDSSNGEIIITDPIYSMRHPDTLINLFLELRRLRDE